jgi:predicted Zn-dependent protease
MAISPLERACESEADYIGSVIASYAGYDTRKAPEAFQRLVEGEGEEEPESESVGDKVKRRLS